ncbi:MAG: hypothetical protein HY658_02250, partial [Actinobacteria bacterium]|nr:hypothetical protein [Actinomycetota bacterium]
MKEPEPAGPGNGTGAGHPLRFGVMCAGTTFPAWQARCLEDLAGLAEPALLVVDARPPRARGRPGRRLLRSDLLWKAYGRLVLAPRSAATRPVDLSAMLAGVPRLDCVVERRGRFSEHFGQDDLAEIRRHDLDFVLRFAFGIIRGEILEAARYGVWSFHHDDEERYRGGPPCFWEVATDDPVTGSMLQRLTERLDGGVVLHRGWFRTVRHSYVRNRDQAYLGSADWPARVCRDVRSGVAGYLDAPPTRSSAPVHRNPGNLRMARFLLRQAGRWVRAQLRGLFRADQWNVGVAERPIASFLERPATDDVRWLPEPRRGTYVADPFAVPGEALTVLVEHYDQRAARGRIDAIEAGPDGPAGRPRPALALPVHASYPYVFEHDKEVYCVPETAEAREVVLHRA